MLNSKIAFITGITGQDGSYLTELLLEKNYIVHGLIRRSSSFNTGRIEHIINNTNLHLHYGDLTDSSNLVSLICHIKPDEIYNLGAQSHVKVSFDMSEYTSDTDGIGTLRLLNAIRTAKIENTCKIYQASTSELYGLVQQIPQTEITPFYPRSPYACAKLFSYWISINYREAYNMHVSNGILFNHESPRRGSTFVTKKITQAVARIKKGYQQKLILGNLDTKRDWGHAKDYVEVMWLMLQQPQPDDFVISTGETHTVREFVEKSFKFVDININWTGEGINEVGKDDFGNIIISIDSKYFRPTEVDLLLGDSTKAFNKLGWRPTISFQQLIEEMVTYDMKILQN